MYNIGIDIIKNNRIKNLLIQNKYKLIKKHLNINEIFYIKKQYIQYITKIFSIKESITKSINTGINYGIILKKIEINKNFSGKSIITYNLKTKIRIKTIISISHDINMTITIIIIII